MSRVLPLQKGVIYGPVDSRRLGRSLGINLMPTAYKVCSFNCVYCHYGWTRYLETDLSGRLCDLATVEAVESALRKSLETIEPPQYITLCGNGEPTLHPDFARMVDTVLRVRDSAGSPAKVAILSNSTGVCRPGVREALQRLDARMMKLDAGTQDVLARINRPAGGVALEKIVNGLSDLSEVTLQSAFVTGEVSNCSDEDIEAWLSQVVRINPIYVQVYSLENAPAMATLRGVPSERLREIVGRLAHSGIKAGAY